ncbi:MAG: VOC family protein [Hyphomonadaceae bacterium]|nr:VOC family protein [Hyphomonadaceae bacterium]
MTKRITAKSGHAARRASGAARKSASGAAKKKAPPTIELRRMSHPNLVVENYEASVAHFRNLYAAELVLDLPKKDWHAYLMEIGGVIIEVFAPHDFFLHARHGPHFFGIEYEADMVQVRAAVAGHGVRIARDIDVALHTHPGDCFGVAFEFYRGSFYAKNTPHLTQQLKPPEYWLAEHPLGLAGLKSFTMAVTDLRAAAKFLKSFIGAEAIYEAERSKLKAQALGLRTADCEVELLAPTGPGPLQAELQRTGQGMRSLVFRVTNLKKAARYFKQRGVSVIDGTAPGSIAVPAEANLGLLFEFSE